VRDFQSGDVMSASARALLFGEFRPRARVCVCVRDVSAVCVEWDQMDRFSRLVDFVVVYLVGDVSSLMLLLYDNEKR